jgi:hypothetical protein
MGLFVSLFFLKTVSCGKRFPEESLIRALNNNLSRTNQISAHFLHYAMNGFWGALEDNFFSLLLSETPYAEESQFTAAKKLLSKGANSGIDEYLGIITGILYF